MIVQFQGGKKGLLENSTDICRGEHRATVKFGAQNGKGLEAQPELKARCSKGRRGHKKHRGGGR